MIEIASLLIFKAFYTFIRQKATHYKEKFGVRRKNYPISWGMQRKEILLWNVKSSKKYYLVIIHVSRRSSLKS